MCMLPEADVNLPDSGDLQNKIYFFGNGNMVRADVVGQAQTQAQKVFLVHGRDEKVPSADVPHKRYQFGDKAVAAVADCLGGIGAKGEDLLFFGAFNIIFEFAGYGLGYFPGCGLGLEEVDPVPAHVDSALYG